MNELKTLQRPGIEPGPPAWQARILPLNQRCCWLRLIVERLYNNITENIVFYMLFLLQINAINMMPHRFISFNKF